MIERAEFGRTGHLSSRVIFGGATLFTMSQEDADPLLDILLEFGVNHWDTAADYGVAEDLMRPWLANHRDDVFLATKTGDRTGDGARASLERSLERMGVDHVDFDPAAQPRRGGRVADGARPGRCASRRSFGLATRG